jgi:hypothetical protein
MTRGRCDLLFLQRNGLPPSNPCRFLRRTTENERPPSQRHELARARRRVPPTIRPSARRRTSKCAPTCSLSVRASLKSGFASVSEIRPSSSRRCGRSRSHYGMNRPTPPRPNDALQHFRRKLNCSRQRDPRRLPARGGWFQSQKLPVDPLAQPKSLLADEAASGGPREYRLV